MSIRRVVLIVGVPALIVGVGIVLTASMGTKSDAIEIEQRRAYKLDSQLVQLKAIARNVERYQQELDQLEERLVRQQIPNIDCSIFSRVIEREGIPNVLGATLAVELGAGFMNSELGPLCVAACTIHIPTDRLDALLELLPGVPPEGSVQMHALDNSEKGRTGVVVTTPVSRAGSCRTNPRLMDISRAQARQESSAGKETWFNRRAVEELREQNDRKERELEELHTKVADLRNFAAKKGLLERRLEAFEHYGKNFWPYQSLRIQLQEKKPEACEPIDVDILDAEAFYWKGCGILTEAYYGLQMNCANDTWMRLTLTRGCALPRCRSQPGRVVLECMKLNLGDDKTGGDGGGSQSEQRD